MKKGSKEDWHKYNEDITWQIKKQKPQRYDDLGEIIIKILEVVLKSDPPCRFPSIILLLDYLSKI